MERAQGARRGALLFPDDWRRGHGGFPVLGFYCPACEIVGEVDQRKIDRHRGATHRELDPLALVPTLQPSRAVREVDRAAA